MKTTLLFLLASLALLSLFSSQPVSAFDSPSELRINFDSALMSIIADGTYKAAIGNITNVFVVGCSPITSFYPMIPYANLKARTQKIIKGELPLRIVTIANFVNNILNATTNPPTGALVNILGEVGLRVNAFYGFSISAEWVYASSSTEMFTALLNKSVDVIAPVASWGATYLTARRNLAFDASCPFYASESKVIVLANSSFTTSADISSSTGLTGCCTAGGSLAVAQGLYSSVTWVLSSEDCTIGLLNGTYSFAFDYTAAGNANFTEIDTGAVSPVVAFFRKRGDISSWLDITQG